MSLITANIKSILSVKFKSRHDSYTDQVSRIFAAKIFIAASLVMGVDWFQDTVQCILRKETDLKSKFVHSSCWIQGFYIYPQMENHMKKSGYYGIPEAIETDGIMNGTSYLCTTKMKFFNGIYNADCIPMERYYFTQYQWMPFYVASLSILFYLPYILFRLVNTDIISLRLNIRHLQVCNFLPVRMTEKKNMTDP